MENYIVFGIILLIALAAVGTLIKRSGRKGCCAGASSYKPRKKKLEQVTSTKVFVVEGMRCEKCANRVTESVNDIPGVAGVVSLKKGIVTVSYAQPVPDEQIKARIERIGYTVTGIRQGTVQ